MNGTGSNDPKTLAEVDAALTALYAAHICVGSSSVGIEIGATLFTPVESWLKRDRDRLAWLLGCRQRLER